MKEYKGKLYSIEIIITQWNTPVPAPTVEYAEFKRKGGTAEQWLAKHLILDDSARIPLCKAVLQ